MRRWRSSIFGMFLVGAMAALLQAASLKETVYLTLPWGEPPCQASRSVPHPQAGDYETAGPVAFAIGEDGKVYLSDLQAFRVQVFSRDASLLYLIQFATSPPDLVEDIGVDQRGHMYLLGDFSEAGKDRKGQLRIYGPEFHLTQALDLSALGIRSPLYLEVGSKQDVFIQDNANFRTFEMTLSGQIVRQVDDDERICWLASQGFFSFKETKNALQVYSLQGHLLREYPESRNDTSVIGVDRLGTLYLAYKKSAQAGSPPGLWVEGFRQDGKVLLSIPITEQPARTLLDPGRLWQIRAARIGPDGAIYAMGNPEDDRFRIYRYQIVP